MKLEKNIIVSVGDRVTIIEPDPKYYAERLHLLGKEFTIKTLYTNHDKYMELDHATGEMVCKSCPIDKIDTFFLLEEPDFEWISDNINVPRELREPEIKLTDKDIVEDLLSTMRNIINAESPGDMYDHAKTALQKYKKRK